MDEKVIKILDIKEGDRFYYPDRNFRIGLCEIRKIEWHHDKQCFYVREIYKDKDGHVRTLRTPRNPWTLLPDQSSVGVYYECFFRTPEEAMAYNIEQFRKRIHQDLKNYDKSCEEWNFTPQHKLTMRLELN